MKTKKMHGFLCQSHAATAVCNSDQRSVIVPRVADRTLVDHPRLIDSKYSRLVDSRRIVAYRQKTLPVALSAGESMPTGKKPVAITADEMRLPTTNTPMARGDKCSPLAVALAAKKDISSSVANSITSRPTTNDQHFQVVVMRVSLHCQGCAGKVKRHLSRMEGVTSFSIDLESKRVTVMGNVSPDGVVESISKVKKAELWTC